MPRHTGTVIVLAMGSRIMHLRKARGWSRQKLVDQIQAVTGVEHAQETIRKLELGQQRLSDYWLDLIARAFDCDMAELLPGREDGLREADVAYLADEDLQGRDLKLARLIYPDGRAEFMQVRSRAMDLAGMIPGDTVLIDLGRHWSDGDVVVIEIRDEEDRGHHQLRLLRDELLIPRSTDSAYRTYRVGDNHVSIMATVVASYRSRLVA